MKPSPLDPQGSPAARFLSNGSYRVLVTATGTGGSWFGDHALTRWVGDRVEDPDGFSIYLRDLESGEFWSVGAHPVAHPADRYQASWAPGRFVIEREDHGIGARLEIGVAATASLEMRRLTLVNRSGRRRRLELTSYMEIVLADPAAHAAHPAFSKLFVQTEHVPALGALLARRRPRAPEERHPWLVHALVGAVPSEHETDRTRFIGRGNSLASPWALREPIALSGTSGSVLDPIFCLRRTLDLPAGEAGVVTFVLGAAWSRDDAVSLVRDCRGAAGIEAAFAASQSSAHDSLAELGLDGANAELAQALAGAMLYRHPGLRARQDVLERARGGRIDLERFGLGLTRPFALVHSRAAALPVLVRMHRYWHSLALPIDLVLLQGEPAAELEALPNDATPILCLDLHALSQAEVDLLEARARLVVTDALPHLGTVERPTPPSLAPAAAGRASGAVRSSHDTKAARSDRDTSAASSRPAAWAVATEELQLANGTGGFGAQGREYVIPMRGQRGVLQGLPPQAWINVIANEGFGFYVSETGAGTTWSQNSREHRLTPWSNDPHLDPHGEALYVRDDDTGEFWSALPGPSPAEGLYEIRHGFGTSRCRHESHGLQLETVLFVPRHEPVKCSVLCLTNTSETARHFSLFAYYRLVLGALSEETAPTILTEEGPAGGVVLARNVAAEEFADAVTFAAVASSDARRVHVSGDRATFMGWNGTPAQPAALQAATLDGKTGAGLDPCIAQQVSIVLPPRASAEVCFLFGEGRDRDEALALVARYEKLEAIERARLAVEEFWDACVGALQITTPSPGLDVLVNGWLPYQTLACRLWARSALYQSGGAYGFRDQLQDAAALVGIWPELTRAQLLLHASHQFVEGDVLHWWHPPLGRGIRTRFVDDLIWLPCVTAHYVSTTGDAGILAEPVRFLTTRSLAPGEDEAYLLPENSSTEADLYEHCCRALDRSLELGAHGLPLFGTGDWNDGMNRVGREGRGESVWMGFFLYAVLGEFTPLCERRGDDVRVHRYLGHRENLRVALETQGWDGDWYRRGYYDNGAPLGSRQNDECRIDGLVQAWAVLSGAASPKRAARAMDSVERHLISESEGIIRLLAPPFETTSQDPGYIKGYVPGVRENGGQYTHAALWIVRALAQVGRNDRVAALLEMLAPVYKARDPAAVAEYRVEPYVVAADVYGVPPHVGRGGWTWYTGSAGWMYRVALESLLGFRTVDGEAILISPCVPDDWPEFALRYRLPGETTCYEIVARNPHGRGLGARSATLDGKPVPVDVGVARLPLWHDGGVHRAEIVLGKQEGDAG